MPEAAVTPCLQSVLGLLAAKAEGARDGQSLSVFSQWERPVPQESSLLQPGPLQSSLPCVYIQEVNRI